MKDPHQQQRRHTDPNGWVGKRMWSEARREWVRVLEATEVCSFWVKARTGGRFITSALRITKIALFSSLLTFGLSAQTPMPPRVVMTLRVVEINGKLYTNVIAGTNNPGGTVVAKKAHAGAEKRWDAVGPWPQFISYEVEVFDTIGKPPAIVSTTNCFYRVESGKDGSQKFIGRVRARDAALPNPSGWQ
jgi:hypothetical protein